MAGFSISVRKTHLKLETNIYDHVKNKSIGWGRPEGFYLATSDTIQGLVAQGRTISETIEIARDIAKKLIESQ
jgi:predicted RNase H-like HicB family nuclease